jgi:hypothetical protein
LNLTLASVPDENREKAKVGPGICPISDYKALLSFFMPDPGMVVTYAFERALFRTFLRWMPSQTVTFRELESTR